MGGRQRAPAELDANGEVLPGATPHSETFLEILEIGGRRMMLLPTNQ